MPQETDSAREANLHAQRIALLYEALPAALVASIGCALALVIINWNVLPQGPLLIWLAYQLVLSAGRYRLACSFKARAPAPAARPHSGRETILLVEDEQAVRLLLPMCCRTTGTGCWKPPTVRKPCAWSPQPAPPSIFWSPT